MLAFAARPETHRVFFGFCFLFLAGVDISFHEPHQNPSVPASAYADRILEMSAVPTLGESRAMLSPSAERTLGVLVNSDPLQMYLGERAELYENCNLLNRIPKTGGFFGIHLAWQRKIDALLDSEKPLTNLLDFLGVSQIAPPDKLFTWESQAGFMPWATVGQGPVFEGDWGTLSFNPRKAVRLEVSPQAVEAVADPEAQLISSNISPEECDFETSASKTTMLVIAQAYYHCWRATVDGNHVPLFRANGAYQALQVPAGQHKVRLVYRDRPFYIGLGITLAALIGCLAGVSKNYRNSSHSGSFSNIQR
jgi:hypothetical protein